MVALLLGRRWTLFVAKTTFRARTVRGVGGTS